ncbi:hypothetical protein [Bacillus sp. EAC]|uniref:hypothetical protein n=1 Tax=Bacillus sp. EAC TaxID=1978338 RepID=UPI000B43FCE2|nr:hypothetical protein [Bacillus sp. EAC]
MAITSVFYVTEKVSGYSSFSFLSSQVPQSQIKQRGGVIRFDPKGIYLHANETHHSVGIITAYINHKGQLEIITEAVAPIITASANPDETLAERGITAGLSVGNQKTVISFSQNGRKLNLNNPADYDKISGSSSNVWVSWTSNQ